MPGDADVERFAAAVEKLDRILSVPAGNSGNQSTITLNAGGVGIWLSVTACAVMLAVNVMLVGIIVSHDRKIDDLKHYLNAVYMLAPHLKPEDK